MKIRMLFVGLMLSLLACSNAGAWGLPSIGGNSSTPAGNPDAFLAKAKKSEALVNKSADQLFMVVATKEQQAKIEEQQQKLKETTDPKEQEAINNAIMTSECAVISSNCADEKLQQDAKNWDDQKKKLAVASLFNLALGAKMAADLVPQGQSLATSIQSNPMMLAKVGTMLESVKCLAGIGTGTARVLIAVPPVFSSANITVELPKSSSAAPIKTDL